MNRTVSRQPDADPVAAIRAFNRFYTRRIGLLDETLLDGRYSLTEVRVLYELAHRDGTTASELARDLGLDLGYVSRLVARLHARRLVRRAGSPGDRRRSVLTLTATGHAAFRAIQAATDAQVAAMVEAIPPDAQDRLVRSMRTIERVLTPTAAQPPCTLRDPRPGDIGWIVHRQAALYASEYGWDWTFEGTIAEIAGAFVRKFDAASEKCWVAEIDGEIVGSIFVVRKSARVAQLRMLYVDPSARGSGLGRRLVGECIAFARITGYRTMTLWTNDVLVAARRIYESAGFVLVDEERHRSFGHELVGQNWCLRL